MLIYFLLDDDSILMHENDEGHYSVHVVLPISSCFKVGFK